MAIIFIVAINTWSIWTAEWNARLKVGWRIGISVVAFLVSVLLMNLIAFNIRADFG